MIKRSITLITLITVLTENILMYQHWCQKLWILKLRPMGIRGTLTILILRTYQPSSGAFL